MGYSYGYTDSGRMALSCDNCGNVGGVRKRTCPHKVTIDSSRGPRHALSYCYPPAVCQPCYKTLGGLRGIHGQDCADGAAKSQAGYDAKQAKLDAGDLMVLAAWGDWKAGVPEGKTLVLFGHGHVFEHRLVPDDSYHPNTKPFLSDYPDATPWENHA